MAPKTAEKKVTPKVAKGGKKGGKKGKKSVESWKIYIYKVLLLALSVHALCAVPAGRLWNKRPAGWCATGRPVHFKAPRRAVPHAEVIVDTWLKSSSPV